MELVNKNNCIVGFDILKFGMSVMIVCLHTKIFAEFSFLNKIISPLLQLAVPCFFVLSSFFFLRKCRTYGYQRTNLIKYLKRLFILYIFWYVVNIPVIIKKLSIFYRASNFNDCSDIIKLIFKIGSYPGSWFITSLMIAILLFYILKLFRCPDFCQFLLSLVLYLFVYYHNYFPSSLQILYEKLCLIRSDLRMSFLVAYFWIVVGYLLSSPALITIFDALKGNIKNSLIYIALIVIWIIIIPISDSFAPIFRIFEAPLIIFLFYFLNFKNKPIWLKLRNYSILIFFIHFIIHIVYVHFRLPDFGLTRFLIVYSLSFTIATLILKYEKKNYFSYLRFSH